MTKTQTQPTPVLGADANPPQPVRVVDVLRLVLASIAAALKIGAEERPC